MHEARLSYLASRYAQRRNAVFLEETKEETKVQLNCNHWLFIAPHFCVKINDEFRCYECGKSEVIRLNLE